MTNSRSSALPYKLLRAWRRKLGCNQGFTLIELLVSLVISGIVVSGLLFIVVELLRTDQREVALDQVQSDMQRAIDYMADDLKEAIYVYSNPAVVTSQLVNLNAEIAANNAVPVLAFWRTDTIDADDIAALPTGAGADGCPPTDATCSVIKARRASYTLVAYYQRPQYGAWEGESTLKRYELAQYNDLTATGAAQYAETAGFSLPFDSTGQTNDFANWSPENPDDPADPGTGGDGGDRTVLVDYLDSIRNTTNDAPNPVVNCQEFTGDPAHVLAPSTATENTGFFACIRPTTAVGGFRTNQDVFLFLRGDATASSQFLQPASENSRLPTLQTQVKLGGVVDRDG